uniref:Putative secreted protein n=1 Tax=Anopheles triannulatus TaxID=58253 RepID=A0A2M4B3W8_9DIPT
MGRQWQRWWRFSFIVNTFPSHGEHPEGDGCVNVLHGYLLRGAYARLVGQLRGFTVLGASTATVVQQSDGQC